MIEIPRERRAGYLRTCRWLVLLCMVTAAFYLWWLLVDARAANPVLFAVLLMAELFNITQAAGFWYTIWHQEWTDPDAVDFASTRERVDVLVTVYGEPAAIVAQTVKAASEIRHPRLTVWVLDDGPSSEIEGIAARHGARYLVRSDRFGAKAGNINHALRFARGDFVAIFDADHAPLPSFLERTMSCFEDADIAFVQTPQSYRNRIDNRVAAGANEQQGLFYGPILRGKNGAGAVFSCGTNVVFRRSALDQAGGIPEDSITEDLRLSLMLAHLRWKSVYVPEILAYGLGPTDVRGFMKQQMRWARGGLEILLKRRPFSFHMAASQWLQYGLSFIYWFTGWAYFGYILLPIAFLFFGLRPVQVPNQYPSHFLPYVFATLFTMVYASNFKLTFRALWFTLASFPVHISAFFAAAFGRVATFVVTSKTAGSRSLASVWPQMVTIAALACAIGYGLVARGTSPSTMDNVAFALGHVLVLQGFVRYAIRPEARARDWVEGVEAESVEGDPPVGDRQDET